MCILSSPPTSWFCPADNLGDFVNINFAAKFFVVLKLNRHVGKKGETGAWNSGWRRVSGLHKPKLTLAGLVKIQIDIILFDKREYFEIC